MIQIIAAVAAAALLASNIATWSFTRDYYEAKADALVAKALQKEAAAQRTLREQMAALETKTQQVQIVERERVRTITKEVSRVVKADPVYVSADCRVTADGVRVYNAAAAGVRLASAELQVAPVPAIPAAVAGPGDAGRPAGNGGVGLRAIPRVPDRPR